MWLLSYAERTGQPVNRILAALVARLRHEIGLVDTFELERRTDTASIPDRRETT
jgi:hypothetical protein